MIVSRMAKPKALGSWGPDDDRWYYPGGSFYGETPIGGDTNFPIGSDSAMRLITVQNCVRMRASTIARLPCHLMQQIGDKKERATDYYLYDKLHSKPNEWMTAPLFWSMVEAFVSLRGNFYAYKMTDSVGRLLQLVPINNRISSVEQKEDLSIEYKIKFKNGQEKILTSDKIFHVMGLTLDGITGVNPIEYARETLGNAFSATRFLGRYYSKGLHPSAVMETEKDLSIPAHKAARKSYQEKYGGLGKSHELMLIDDNMKIKFPEIKLIDAQFLEQNKLTEAQICGLYRVPLMLINGSDKSPTYASAEQFLLFYQMYSIDAPLYEAAINMQLLSGSERKKYYAKYSIEGLLRGSMKDRAEFYKTLINCEVMAPNEARGFEDWNPYEGGNEFRVRTSTTKDSGKNSGDEK